MDGPTLRIALIGCGSHAVRNVLPALQWAPAQLCAVCDLNAQRAQKAARTFGAPNFYTDWRQMLDHEKLDAVFLVLATDENGEPRYPAFAVELMQRGVHVWMEKPAAASSHAVRQMQEVSAQTGKTVGVGLKKMFAPANVAAKKWSEAPEFGRVTSITARYPQNLFGAASRHDSQKMAGFLDHIVHPFSMLRLLGGDIKSLLFERCAHNGASVTLLQFASGAVGSLHLSAGQSELAPLERTEIVGEGSNIVIENNIRATYYRAGNPRGGYGNSPSFFDIEGEAPLFFEPEFSLGNLHNKGLFLLGYAPEIREFCAAALENRAPEQGNLDDALALAAVYEAYRDGVEGERILLP